MRILRRSARLLITVAAAALLSACSSSLERFATANAAEEQTNPSDADPVYTAAIRRPPQRVIKTRDTYRAADVEPLVEEPIVSKPLASAKVTKPKLALDYSDSYGAKPKYKQKPQVAAIESQPLDDTPAEETYTPPVKRLSKPVPVAKSGRIRVEPGMTLYSIARSNGVTVDELASANGLKKPYWVSAGTVLLMPGVASPVVPQNSLQAQKKQIEEEQGASLAEEETSYVPPKKIKTASNSMHQVESGDTLYSLGRKYGLSPYTIADANNLSHDATLVLGQKVRIPAGGKVAAVKQAAPVAQPEPEVIADNSEPEVFTKPTRKKPQLKLDDEPKAPEQVAENEPVAAEPVTPKVPKLKDLAPKADPTALSLRWPVRGKVISEYGPKTNGMKNEGINISVPEGTSIRAAESGVVAYAGSELKGYGNLILIRHAGGYVTAYAHAKELMVKRGDKINRGDVIAKAGQSGAVSSPQLHFEVRKGATAIDPQKFLGSSTAMN